MNAVTDITAARLIGRDDTFCDGATIRARAARIPVAQMAAYLHVPTRAH